MCNRKKHYRNEFLLSGVSILGVCDTCDRLGNIHSGGFWLFLGIQHHIPYGGADEEATDCHGGHAEGKLAPLSGAEPYQGDGLVASGTAPHLLLSFLPDPSCGYPHFSSNLQSLPSLFLYELGK
ncbi:hypothetical protein SLA2020_477800 [Shorea laevis]